MPTWHGAELAFLQEKGKYSVIILPASTEIAAFAGSLKPAQAEGSQPTLHSICRDRNDEYGNEAEMQEAECTSVTYRVA